MDERNGDKGFRVVDKRSMPEPEPEAGVGPVAPPAEPQLRTEADGRAAGHSAPGFIDLLQSLQYSAMIHLGMVQGPDGKRSPADLPAAQDAIDMMGVLKEKTKGNLTAEEDGILTEGLYVLRMSYLAALKSDK